MELHFRKLYYGWYIVICCAVVMALANSTVYTVASLFIIPVCEDFGISRAAFSAHISVFMSSSMLASLLLGRILARHGIKQLMVTMAIVVSMCFAVYSIARNIWYFYIASFFVGFAATLAGLASISVLISRWFPANMRGKATGIAMCGSGVGSTVLLPFFTGINNSYGWRVSYMLMSALVLLVLVPLMLLVIRSSPTDKGLPEISDGAMTHSSTADDAEYRAASRSPLFFMLLISSFIMGFDCVIFNINSFSYFCSIGFSSTDASLFASLSAAVLVVSKIMTGTIADKFGARAASLLNCICVLLGCAFAALSSALPAFALLVAVFFGLGNATTTVTVPLLSGAVFGYKSYSSFVGAANMGCFMGQLLGPVFSNFIFDISGSYTPSFVFAFFVMALNIFIIFRMFSLRKSYI